MLYAVTFPLPYIYVKSCQRHAHLRTVLVEGIPAKMRSTVTLATYFETLYRNAILHVRLCQNIRYLDRLVKQQLMTLRCLERHAYLQQMTNDMGSTQGKSPNSGAETMIFYKRLLVKISGEIDEEQRRARKLAGIADALGGRDAIQVIEGYMQVRGR